MNALWSPYLMFPRSLDGGFQPSGAVGDEEGGGRTAVAAARCRKLSLPFLFLPFC